MDQVVQEKAQWPAALVRNFLCLFYFPDYFIDMLPRKF